MGVRAFLISVKQWLSPRWKHNKNRLMLASYFEATRYFARGLSQFCFFHVWLIFKMNASTAACTVT